MAFFRKKRSEEDEKAEELLRSILGDDWEQSTPRRGRPPERDLMGRRLDEMTDSEIIEQVDSSLAAKRTRKVDIERSLENKELSDDERSALLDELHHLEGFLWLARGGDRQGESPPARRS